MGQAKVRVWAIIGGAGVGKSTTIGHLTSMIGQGSGGLKKGAGGWREVPVRGGGYLTVLAMRQAWQEARRSPAEVVTFAKTKIKTKESEVTPVSVGYLNFLMALRFDPVVVGARTYPSGAEYLAHFVNEGWLIESIVLMSPTDLRAQDNYRFFGAPTYWHYGSGEFEIASMVGRVRDHFGWA